MFALLRGSPFLKEIKMVIDTVEKNSGINECPLCNSYKNMRITSESSFYETKGRNGFCLIYLECNNCHLGIWSHGCKLNSYEGHRDFLARRWNKLRGETNEKKQTSISLQGV